MMVGERHKHKEFHLVMRLSATGKEAEEFAKKLQRVVNSVRRKHFPDTTIHDYKLGYLM